MSIRIFPESQQGVGAFNGGEIVENKPIGFPQDHSVLRPYSNLFYWAHARAVTDSTIGLHPHQGFEICSFILAGEIRHYDTKLRDWRPLKAGDVQIIRAGNGISHAEFMGKDAEMFQIWFDPNLAKTLEQPASYDDYRADAFPVAQAPGVRITTMIGEGSPFRMDTPGVRVQRFELDPDASYTIEAGRDKLYSLYVIKGEVLLNGELAKEKDFVLGGELDAITLEAKAGASVFMIESPAHPGYHTYAGR